jgi:hypothetical protein
MRVYSTANDTVQLLNTWASGISGTIGGIAFFPNDPLNHGLLSGKSCCIKIISIASPYSISSVYTFTYDYDLQ